MKTVLFTILCVMLSTSGYAADRMNMKGTKIRGNQELPKVLYIVPWKQAKVPNLNQPPLKSLINEALTPVDRNGLMRTSLQPTPANSCRNTGNKILLTFGQFSNRVICKTAKRLYLYDRVLMKR
ncbi:MAG: hypothetical protein P8Z75_13235 [Gammaproteobacteria bacterium]